MGLWQSWDFELKSPRSQSGAIIAKPPGLKGKRIHSILPFLLLVKMTPHLCTAASFPIGRKEYRGRWVLLVVVMVKQSSTVVDPT